MTPEPSPPTPCWYAKGRFRPEFLDGTEERGLAAYVAESDLSSHTTKPGLIVNDARKALSLLAAAFYDHPERDLTVIGITGTKGKTTTAYFTQSILNTYSAGRCALFSSVDNCLDGHTYAESDLTTPESLDAFRMMRQAVDNGMKYLVMEVSPRPTRSTAYTASPSTWPHSSTSRRTTSARSNTPRLRTTCIASARSSPTAARWCSARSAGISGYCARTPPCIRCRSANSVCSTTCPGTEPTTRPAHGLRTARTAPTGCAWTATTWAEFSLALDGDFNYKNALAAIAIAHAAGVPADCEALRALEHTKVPGRMMQYRDERTSTIAIVDYAHNYDSVVKLLDYVSTRYGERNPRITLVAGSAGNKAIDRREGIVKAAQDRISRFVFTAEDTDTEPYEDICRDMADHVTNSHVASDTIIDRTQAIASGIA